MKNELKITIVGTSAGDVEKIKPSFALMCSNKFAVEAIASLPEAYNVTPTGKRFCIAVPSGDCLKVVLAANSIASYLQLPMGGALAVITESENWKTLLPSYLEAEAAAKTAAAALAAARGAIKYYGNVEKDPDSGEFTFPAGTPEFMRAKFIAANDSAKAAREHFADEKKKLDRVVWSFMRESVERFFTAIQQ